MIETKRTIIWFVNEANYRRTEYKTTLGRIGKVDPLTIVQKIEIDHANRWYMHNPESVLENETHKILEDFDIRITNLSQTIRSNDSQQKKRTCRMVDFTVLGRQQSKMKESEKRD